ncbi:MAG: hypothetical protein FJW27_13305 [Acidimicrobiia bacterium]|nr:hypothetical protein [Acidimicrobiia bacterium]
MKASIQLVGLLTLGLLLCRSVAEAQFLPAPPVITNPRVRMGLFDLAHVISLPNVGLDTNVFNEPDIAEPQRDFAMSFAPQTDIAAHLGRTWLMEGSYLRSRERPSYEIDLRADRRERGGAITTEVRAWSRTILGGRLEHRDLKFRDRELFSGRNLGDELNRARLTGTASIRYELTPLTSVAVEASAFDERFAYSQWRSTTSTQVAGGLRFDPSALIKGHALVGYRQLASSSAVFPAYTGPTLSVNLSSVAGASTRLGFESVRDVEYSFDPERPYYVLSGLSGTVTRRLFRAGGRPSACGLAHAGVPHPHGRCRGARPPAGSSRHLRRELRLPTRQEHARHIRHRVSAPHFTHHAPELPW